MPCKEGLGDLGWFSLQKGWFWGEPLVPTRTASRKWRWVFHRLEDEEQQTLKQERFRMDVRRNFFPHEYSPAVAQTAHGYRAISILGGFQDPPDTAPGNLVWSHS